MGYIYCITNLINGKQYIGKTQLSINERFKEHCRASRKEYGNRPLYDAMNKYGIENFNIRQLEQVEDETKLDEREIYWIQELQTYGKGGYNATKGGEGTMFYDPQEIVDLYNLGYSQVQVAEKVGCGADTVCRILKAKGIKARSCNKEIAQYDLAGNFIQSFSSATQATQWVLDFVDNTKKKQSVKACICKCGCGKQQSAYGYKWRYTSAGS